MNSNAGYCKVIAYNNNYFVRIIRVYFSLIVSLLKHDYDILFIGFAPQFLFLLFPFFPKGKVLIIDFFISFYDTLVDDRKIIREESALAKIVHKIDSYVINRADFVIADTNAHKEYFVEEFQIPVFWKQ